mmetsp:Transcript_23594/g.67617  ORF Transcript_23594/g.67617 Transcript_23594/m.67617 type:complete len:233 (-) Transcript_23594:1572-2270(-)
MYSLISKRINASSSSNINSLNALHNSVFPTPVGPRKIMEAMGLDGSFRPARDRCTASVTTSMASSCPITLSLSLSAMFRILSRSVSRSLFGGIPVQMATTLAISSATTSSRSIGPSPLLLALAASRISSSFRSSSSKAGSFEYFNSAAVFKSNSRSHFSISKFTSAISFFRFLRRSTPPFSAIHLAFISSDCRLSLSNSLSIPNNRSLSAAVPLLPSFFSTSDFSERRSISN